MSCVFCDGVIDLSDKENVRTVRQQRGLIIFQSCAAKRNDKKHEDIFANISLPFNVHRKCVTDYTRPQTIESHAKLKRSNNTEDCEHLPTPPKLRSSTQGFRKKPSVCSVPNRYNSISREYHLIGDVVIQTLHPLMQIFNN